MYINKSLCFLEQVVLALADRRREHVPFRQSKLTACLKDSIGGNCNTRLVANVWAEAAQIEETVCHSLTLVVAVLARAGFSSGRSALFSRRSRIFHLLRFFFTSAKEVMVSSPSVCLFVCRIMLKLLD